MNDNEFVDKQGTHYPSAESYLFTGILHGCGCGNSEDIGHDVMQVFLSIARKDETLYELIYSDKYHELIAHILDGAGLLEHGSSIGGSWLSPKGEEVFAEITTPPPPSQGDEEKKP